jgi:poly(glycerol-phosphate) alpha-glucosyltransferase
LIRGWCQVREQSSAARDWHLVIAGWDQGNHQSELQSLAAKLHVESAVSFVGPLVGDDKSAALAHAEGFILPSLSEGLPMAVLEAWSFQLPVIMTAACNLPEGFEAGAAIEAKPTGESIAEAINRLVDTSAEQRRQIGAAGLRLVRDQFTWTGVCKKLKSVYTHCLQGTPCDEIWSG